jgi:hypothetical protein
MGTNDAPVDVAHTAPAHAQQCLHDMKTQCRLSAGIVIMIIGSEETACLGLTIKVLVCWSTMAAESAKTVILALQEL